MRLILFVFMTIFIFFLSPKLVYAQSNYTDGYVDNNGVKLHYVTKGNGPLLVFLHGFPDFWFTWTYQLDQLSTDYTVVAFDLRGYNLSDSPESVEQYQMRYLIQDLVAIINKFDPSGAIVIANDWGGIIAWYTAMFYPNKVKGLIACNASNPYSFYEYIKQNPTTSDYTQKLISKDAAETLIIDTLISMANVSTELKLQYINAYKQTRIQAMLNYYIANYPKTTSNNRTVNIKQVKSKVLMIHGLKDSAFPPGSLNHSWNYITQDLTIKTIPDGGHFIQRDHPKKVTHYIKTWLTENF